LANGVAENMALVSNKERHQQMNKHFPQEKKIKKKLTSTITYNEV